MVIPDTVEWKELCGLQMGPKVTVKFYKQNLHCYMTVVPLQKMKNGSGEDLPWKLPHPLLDSKKEMLVFTNLWKDVAQRDVDRLYDDKCITSILMIIIMLDDCTAHGCDEHCRTYMPP